MSTSSTSSPSPCAHALMRLWHLPILAAVLLDDVYFLERLPGSSMMYPNWPAVITPHASQVRWRLIQHDQGGLDVLDELPTDSIAGDEFDVGDLGSRIRGHVLVDPASHRTRSRDDGETSVEGPEMMRDLGAETLVVDHPNVQEADRRRGEDGVDSSRVPQIGIAIQVVETP